MAEARGDGEATGSGRVREKDRRVIRTKGAIRDAFQRLLEEREYRAITISAIAREANIDRKTFYLHYPSVDAVLDELFRERARIVVGQLQDGVLSSDGSIDVGALYRELSIGAVESFKRQSKSAVMHVPSDLVLGKVESALTEALISDDRLGLASMGPYLGYCVSFFVAGLFAVYRRWTLLDSDVPLDSLAEMASFTMLEGLNGLMRASQDGEACLR